MTEIRRQIGKVGGGKGIIVCFLNQLYQIESRDWFERSQQSKASKMIITDSYENSRISGQGVV
jgi:hypothetical protein